MKSYIFIYFFSSPNSLVILCSGITTFPYHFSKAICYHQKKFHNRHHSPSPQPANGAPPHCNGGEFGGEMRWMPTVLTKKWKVIKNGTWGALRLVHMIPTLQEIHNSKVCSRKYCPLDLTIILKQVTAPLEWRSIETKCVTIVNT